MIAAAVFVIPGVLAATFSLTDVTFHTGESKTVNLTTYLTLDANEALTGYSIPATTHILTSAPTNGNVTFSVQPAYTDWTGLESVSLTIRTNVTNLTKTIDVLVTDITDDGKLIFSDGPDVEDQTGDDSELVPGDTIEVTFELENKFTTAIDINNVKVKTWLQDSSGDRITDREETDSFDLSDGDTEDGTLTLRVPVDTEEDTLYLFVRAEGEDDYDVTHTALYVEELELEKQENEIAIDAVTISPDPAVCGQALDITVDMWNIGTEEQEAKIHVTNSDLGVDVYSDLLDLDNSGDDREVVTTLSVLLGNSIKPGNYTLDVDVSYNSGKDAVSGDAAINVICSGYVAGTTDNDDDSGSAGAGALTFADTSVEGKQGQQLKITATLRNTGSTAAVYTFELAGIQDWATGFVEPDTVTLAGGASSDVFVYITPKTSATGDETATLTVKSGGTTLESETLTVELPEKPTLSITSLGNIPAIDQTTAALIIIAVLVVVGLLLYGRKRSASGVQTYGKKKGRPVDDEE